MEFNLWNLGTSQGARGHILTDEESRKPMRHCEDLNVTLHGPSGEEYVAYKSCGAASQLSGRFTDSLVQIALACT